MKRLISILLALLFMFSGMFAFAGTIPALADDDDDDDDDDDAPLQLFVILCLFGVTEIEFPEDEDFFVRHGWGLGDPLWSDLTPEEQAAALAPTTRFDLLVDGEPVGPDEETFEVLANGVGAKLFRTDFDDDEAEDTRVFTGMWSLDGLLAVPPLFVPGPPGEAVLQASCDLTVHFVDIDDDDDDD